AVELVGGRGGQNRTNRTDGTNRTNGIFIGPIGPIGPISPIGRRRWRRVHHHVPARVQGEQHLLQHLFARGDPRFVQQPFADHPADLLHVGRDLQQIREQPPRQRPLAVQPCRRGRLQALELAFGPVTVVFLPWPLLALPVLL